MSSRHPYLIHLPHRGTIQCSGRPSSYLRLFSRPCIRDAIFVHSPLQLPSTAFLSYPMHSLTSIMALNLQPRDEGLVNLSVPKASQACISCRKQKRKCDKSVPTCGLCARMNRQCDYSDSPSAPTANDVAALQARLAELENQLKEVTRNSSSPGTASNIFPDTTGNSSNNNTQQHQASPSIIPSNSHSDPLYLLPDSSASVSASTNHFPPSLLLDIDVYKWANHSISPPSLAVPSFVYSILSRGSGSGSGISPGSSSNSSSNSSSSNTNTAIQDIATSYFSTVHLWFPFISKKRMMLGHTLHEAGSDLAMLFLAMKLVVMLPREGMERGGVVDNEVYVAAKRMLSLLEGAGCVSLLQLQAMVLVAVYEYGQGIMPAAWMSVAAAARYAELCGLPGFKESSAVLGAVATWTESEERRRVWWAIYILDRVICLGNKKRVVMPEPEKHYLLPVDDDVWDNGDPGRALSAGIITPVEQPQGRFARLVQSSMLVSRTITHVRTTLRNQQLGGGGDNGDPFDINEVDDLINTLTSFSTLIQQELLPSLSLACPTQSKGSISSTSSPPNWHFLTSNSIPLNPPYHHHPSPPSLYPPQPNPLNPASLPPLGLTYSALFLLFDIHCCPENLFNGPGATGFENLQPKTANQLSLQVRSVARLRSLSSGAVRELCMELLDTAVLPQGLAMVSPLCLDSLYSGLATLRWLWKEGGDSLPPEVGTWEGGGAPGVGITVTQAMEDVSKCLSRLSSRWRLAEEYLGLVGYHDVGVAMAWKPHGGKGVPC